MGFRSDTNYPGCHIHGWLLCAFHMGAYTLRSQREAAIKLCQKLNEKAVRMVGGLNLKLAFYVSKYPKNSIKRHACIN